jgi:hypothetical protein
MKNVRVKVIKYTCFNGYTFGICEGKKVLLQHRKSSGSWLWFTEKAAIRNAKAMAKRIGIPYDPEIIKQHGC